MPSKRKIYPVKYKETKYVRTQSCFRNHSPAGHYCLSGAGWWADLGQNVSQYQRIWCPSDRSMRNRSSANDTSIPGVGKAIRDVFPVALRTLNTRWASMWLFGGAKPPEWGTAHPPASQSMERNPFPQPLTAPTGDGRVENPWHSQAVPINQELPPIAALLNICSSFCITKTMRVLWGEAVPPRDNLSPFGVGVNTTMNALPQFAHL